MDTLYFSTLRYNDGYIYLTFIDSTGKNYSFNFSAESYLVASIQDCISHYNLDKKAKQIKEIEKQIADLQVLLADLKK